MILLLNPLICFALLRKSVPLIKGDRNSAADEFQGVFENIMVDRPEAKPKGRGFIKHQEG